LPDSRRIVSLEFAKKLVFEIEGRLMPLSRGSCLSSRAGLETYDTSEFCQRIIIRKELVVSACAIRQLFFRHHPFHSKTLQLMPAQCG